MVEWYMVLESEKVLGSILSKVAEYSFFLAFWSLDDPLGFLGIILIVYRNHSVVAQEIYSPAGDVSLTCTRLSIPVHSPIHQCERTHEFFLCTTGVYSFANPCGKSSLSVGKSPVPWKCIYI